MMPPTRCPTRRPTRFSAAVRLLHWLMAPLLFAMLLIGTGMVTTLSPWRLRLVGLHEPLGIALLVLAVLRLGLRWRGSAPALPASMPFPMRIAAKASHWLLYGAMLAMPLIGWAMLSAAGAPLPGVGGFHLPPLIPVDTALYACLRALHTVVGELFFVLIAVHVLAGLLHALLLKDGVFDAIRPGRGR